MKKPETKFKEKIAPKLHGLPNSWWVKTSMLSIRGIPDFLGCVRGAFVALELKKDAKAKLDPLQGWVLKSIEDAGGYAVRVDPENWEEVWAHLQKLAVVSGT